MLNDLVYGDWLIAQYNPVSLFSLRSTYATNKGGKTLLVPTPYAVKMALLDVCFRAYSGPDAEIAARRTFDWIKAQPVRIQPPAECIVQNTFLFPIGPPTRVWASTRITVRALTPSTISPFAQCNLLAAGSYVAKFARSVGEMPGFDSQRNTLSFSAHLP